MYRLTAALLLVAATSVAASAQMPIPSYWENDRGSVINIYTNISIALRCSGCFAGYFWNRDAGFKCQTSPTNPKPYDVTGRSGGGPVTFKVVWNNGIEDCHSTTVWKGYVDFDNIMTTRWVLTGPGIKPITGTDVFYPRQ